MATDKIEIINRALLAIGSSPIVSESDGTKSQITMSTLYNGARDAELRAHPWNSATGRQIISATTTTPAHGWSYSFDWPSDALRILSNDEAMRDVDHKIEGKKILANQDTLEVVYIKKMDDVTKMDELLADTIAARLAWKGAQRLSDDTTLIAQLKQDYVETRATARLVDAQEGNVPETEPEDWINSRFL